MTRRPQEERKGPLDAVVPAAGLSRRMGKEKALLPFRSSTVLETVLGALVEAGVRETIVVLRPGLAGAPELAGRWNARVIVNSRSEEEMLTSVRLGIAALSSDVEAFFLWPVDHPAVSAPTLAALSRAADRTSVVIPRYRGRRGHPVIVGADLRASIERIPPGEGLRHLWRTHRQAVREMDVDDAGILVDLDTPEDYERALRLEG